MSGLIVCSTLVLACLVASASCLYGEPCTTIPSFDDIPRNGEIKDIYTNSTCVDGKIWWNYPRGELRVHFRYDDQSKPFKVCLNTFMGVDFQSIVDVTDGTDHDVDVVNSDVNNRKVCSTSVSSEVILVLKAPPLMTYMTLTGYTLEFQ